MSNFPIIITPKPKLTLGPLPHDDKYSDLTLICEDQEFKVHKVVVCTQSSVLAAACNGKFKEAVTGIVEITNFDSHTVKRMIDYLYVKKYTVDLDDHRVEEDEDEGDEEETEGSKDEDKAEPQPQPQDDNPSRIENSYASSRDSSSSGKKDLPGSTPEADEVAALLLLHAHVNGIADYYDVPELRIMANNNFEEIIDRFWTPEGFSEVIDEVLTSTGDKHIHDLIAQSTATHISRLVDRVEFVNLKTIGPFAATVMKKTANILAGQKASFQSQINILEYNLSDAKGELEYTKKQLGALTERMNRLLDVSQRTKRCRNQDCGQEITMYMDVYDWQYTLRCSRCRCKHPGKTAPVVITSSQEGA